MPFKRGARITTETKRWSPHLDLALPIRERDIQQFKEWVNWNGYTTSHGGHDLAAYITRDGKCVLGLPEGTPVRAVANGTVTGTHQTMNGYHSEVIVEHTLPKRLPRVYTTNAGLLSVYSHVTPKVKYMQKVRKGQIIGIVHKDSGEEAGRLVHVHFMLYNAGFEEPRQRKVNPALIFPQLSRNRTAPNGNRAFTIPELGEPIEIVIANFKKLLLQ